MLLSARDAGRKDNRMLLVVALHARGGDAASAIRSARADFGERPDVFAPQAARPCNPFQSNLRSAAAYAGFSWYLGDDPARPEAASFGDALQQVEAFLAPIRRDYVLTGEGQGACLAVALACYPLRHLIGVRLSNGSFPSIDGWEPPLAGLADHSFLLTPAVADSELGRKLQAYSQRVSVDHSRYPTSAWILRGSGVLTAGA